MLTGNRALALTGATVIAVVVTSFLVVLELPALLLAALGLAAIMAIARWPIALTVVLLVAAVPFMRPGVLGERYSIVALILAAIALATHVTFKHARLSPMPRQMRSALLWLLLAWLWLIARELVVPNPDPTLLLQRLAGTLAVVLVFAVVLADDTVRRYVLRGVIGVLMVTSLSALITAALWAVSGPESWLVLREAPLGYESRATPLYAPFTPGYGRVDILGLKLPRFLGLGRESGVAAMLIAWAYFALPWAGWDRRGPKLVLLGGLTLTLSTAGFGLFIGAWCVDRLLSPRRGGSSVRVVAQYLGVLVLAGAVWMAIYAPLLGVVAKGQANPFSISDRAGAAREGLHALLTDPLFSTEVAPNSGINLIGALAVHGLPWVLLVSAMFIIPRVHSKDPGQTTAPIIVLYGSVLVAQPLTDSTLIFVLVLLTYFEAGERPRRAVRETLRSERLSLAISERTGSRHESRRSTAERSGYRSCF